MKKITLALALLLALPVFGQDVARMARKQIAPAPEPVAVPAPLGPFPLDGAFIYMPDPQCLQNGVATQFPDLAKSICMRAKTIEYLIGEVTAGRVAVGQGFRDCTYPSDPAWPSCIERVLRGATPEIRFGQTPFWVVGSIGGVRYVGCAAGVAYSSFIRVSLADASRVYRLVAWETSNSILAYTLDRFTAADGPVTAAATSYAASACGVN